MTGMTQRLVGTSMMQSNSLMGMLSGLSAHGGGGAVSGPSHANFTPIHAIGPAGTGQAGALAAQQAALTQGLLTNIMGHPLSIGAALASGMGLVGLAAAKGLGAGGLGNLYRITGGGGKGQPSHSRDTEDILKRFNRNG
ncbi:MAG TPA: hypothetical protein PK613_13540 [Anaerolineaceae bacterium]|nr:hypothetical protein [Anaerolineaceae bacterium]